MSCETTANSDIPCASDIGLLSPSKGTSSSLYSVPSQVPFQISDDVDRLLGPPPPLIPNTLSASSTYVPTWNDNAVAHSESHIAKRPVDESSGGSVMSPPFLLPISSVQVPVHNNFGYVANYGYQRFGQSNCFSPPPFSVSYGSLCSSAPFQSTFVSPVQQDNLPSVYVPFGFALQRVTFLGVMAVRVELGDYLHQGTLCCGIRKEFCF